MATTQYITRKRCQKCHIIADWNPSRDGQNPVCAAGHRMRLLTIDGRVGTGVCDERCWSAIRGSCRCSCGGSRHATTFGVIESGH